MTVSTTDDVIKAAASIARDAAEGRLSPAGLEQQAVAECRELFGTVVGEGDPLWDLHRDVARQVLALDGIPAAELSEWLAVSRQRAAEPVGQPEPETAAALAEPEPVAPELAEQPEPEADAEPDPEPVADSVTAVTPPRCADGYDPLAGWSPGGSRR